MGRKERNNIDFFPHPVSHGRKMYYIRSKYGNDGYAVWFMLLEKLGEADYHYLNLADEVQLMYLSAEFKIDDAVLIDIINDLVKLGEFDSGLWVKRQILFSEKFNKSVEEAYRKRSNEISTLKSLLRSLDDKGCRKSDKGCRESDNNRSDGVGNTQIRLDKSRVDKSRVSVSKDTSMSQLSELDESDWNEWEKIGIAFWRLAQQTLDILEIDTEEQKKIKCKSWVDPIRLAFQQDKRKLEDFHRAFHFMQNEDPFAKFSWRKNVRSGAKLREKMDDILISAGTKGKSKADQSKDNAREVMKEVLSEN